MRRKLVKQGPSTLTVSMPSEWVKANNLLAGRDVVVAIENNNVVISTEVQDEQGASASVDVREYSSTLIGLLLHAFHKKGFDEVKLACTPAQIPYIQDCVNKKLLGYEIVEQHHDGVVVRFVTRVDAQELQTLIRRAFLVTISLAEGVAEAEGDLKELIVLEETNNRLVNYCERIIVRSIHHDGGAVFRYVIAWLLEKIADQYKDIIKAGHVDKRDAETCLRLLKQFYELYYRYGYKRHDTFVRDLTAEIEEFTRRRSVFLPILSSLYQTGGSIIALHAVPHESGGD